jgi:competence protein ComEC
MNRRSKQFIAFLFICLAVWLFATLPRLDPKKDNLFRVAFFDIGQGDSIFLTTPHEQQILIDGGPDSKILSRLGKEMPFYDRTIDLVIVSHNHSDHIAGLNQVLERYKVNEIWISGAIHTTNEYIKLLELIRDKNIPTKLVWQGRETNIDGVQLNVVHPITSAEGIRPDDQHDATIVVRALYGENSFLFTGDINEGHEQAMIKSGVPISADVLKVPHHGSASGLALNFLNLVNPKYAVIQSGKDNKYGHPTASILQKLNDRGIIIYRNDLNGTIRATSDGKTMSWKTERPYK